jgi:cellulose synthase/poly-beta-1,6-N-acetylglucosamine synthase-like glycosyltransferase
VSVVISVYNEEGVLHEKLENLAHIAYPNGRMEFLLGSDGSSDRTCEILAASTLKNLKVFTFAERRGKVAVLNDLVACAGGEVVVFSDANTLYDDHTVDCLVRHFADPAVGGVCGELLLHAEHGTTGAEEISYWKYETLLKGWESAYRSIVGATGGVYAIRRNVFKALPTQKPVVDDFLIPLEVLRHGLRMIYEPAALAFEEIAGSVRAEFNRRVRIGAQNFSGIPDFIDLLNPLRGYVAFALWSHKILRWCVPFFALAVFGASGVLACGDRGFLMIFGAEMAVLAAVLFGFVAERLHLEIGRLGLPYYVIAMNVALLVGFFRSISGSQATIWTTEREAWAREKSS